MSQEIVEVASNALALGDLGEMFDLVLRQLQLRFRTVRDRSEMVPNSHQDDQQQHGNPKPHRQLQAMRVKTTDDDLERDKAKHTSKIGACLLYTSPSPR